MTNHFQLDHQDERRWVLLLQDIERNRIAQLRLQANTFARAASKAAPEGLTDGRA